MTVEIKVPVLPESVADATVAKWYKQPGETIKRDENLVDLETDKVMLEVPAPTDGVLKSVAKEEGSVVTAEEVLAVLEEGAVPETSANTAQEKSSEKASSANEPTASTSAVEALSPAVRRLVAEHSIDVSKLKGTGKDSRLTKEDIESYLSQSSTHQPTPAASSNGRVGPVVTGIREEKRVPMSRLRARVAERLLEVKQGTAMLTTFNEVNMQPIMDLRARYKERFEKEYGVKLGFMSFFVKAAIAALKKFPAINASIDGNDIVYHGYFDVGIAVSTERGLVVPIIQDADRLSVSDIEKAILDYAKRARDGKLALEEITGGTFTITNGGVFGSMLSTPILNPPQSAILGMHNIVKRAVVENDQVVVRPMMYLALSYDHRIIDGRESVLFLRSIKEVLEDPARLVLGL